MKNIKNFFLALIVLCGGLGLVFGTFYWAGAGFYLIKGDTHKYETLPQQNAAYILAGLGVIAGITLIVSFLSNLGELIGDRINNFLYEAQRSSDSKIKQGLYKYFERFFR